MELLYKEINKLNKKLKNNENSSNSGNKTIVETNNGEINNTVNNNIHITIHSYENTDYSVIKNDIHKCIENGRLNEAKLIKLLHFNKKFPQNHNVKIQNRRDNRVLTYNGEKFEEYGDRQEGILDFIDTTLEKTGDTLNKDEDIDDKYLIAVQNAPIHIENLKEKQKRQKARDLGRVLYNGKDVVDKTHNN